MRSASQNLFIINDKQMEFEKKHLDTNSLGFNINLNDQKNDSYAD
jgi:hypothetical protein